MRARAGSPGDLKDRFDGGASRLRHGAGEAGEREFFGALPEFALDLTVGVTDWLSLAVHAHHQPEDEDVLGIVQGYLEITPPPAGQFRFDAKLGAFFPGISRENRGAAWSNTYTISNSPSMTWIAEEVRPVGLAIGGRFLGESYAVSGEASLFYANDRSGGSLAFGWLVAE